MCPVAGEVEGTAQCIEAKLTMAQDAPALLEPTPCEAEGIDRGAEEATAEMPLTRGVDESEIEARMVRDQNASTKELQ